METIAPGLGPLVLDNPDQYQFALANETLMLRGCVQRWLPGTHSVIMLCCLDYAVW